jgi:hypothetical protein
MALQKTPVNLNLITGADTKANEQIASTYKDMVNVVFTGDMTVKKMKGYDLLAELPPDEFYSGVFTRDNELLAQSDKGTYKYFEHAEEIQKIDSIGSTAIDQLNSYGEVFIAGAVHDMHIGISREAVDDGSGSFTDRFLINHTFTDKFGNVINTIQSPYIIIATFAKNEQTFRGLKALVNTEELSGIFSDEFFVLEPDDAGYFRIVRFSYDPGSNTFSELADYTQATYTYGSIQMLDMYCDGTSIFLAFKTSIFTNPTLWRFSMLALTLDDAFTLYHGDPAGLVPIYSSLQIHARDNDTIYVTSASAPLGVDGQPGTTFLDISIYNKNPLAFVSDHLAKSATATVGTSERAHWICRVLSDTTANAILTTVYVAPNAAVTAYTYPYLLMPITAFNNGSPLGTRADVAIYQGAIPVSEIFTENGEDYIFLISGAGINSIYHIVRVSDGAPMATFCASKVIQAKTPSIRIWNLSNNSADKYTFVINKPYKYDGKWFFAVRKIRPAGADYYCEPALFSFDFDASLINTQLEIVGKTTVFNGQPAYYDGRDFSEFGLNNRPLILEAKTVSSAGTLPIDTAYQVVAVYRWKDNSGNVYYSDISNIAGGTTPIPVDVAGTYAIQFNVYCPLVTTKKNIELLIYVKKGSDQFRLYQEVTFSKDRAFNRVAYTGEIETYPATELEFLPFTGTFVAGGDYPTSPLTGTVASSIYEDRIFTLTKDKPISLVYSQKKILGWGTEFNQDIFYQDIYDKRGVYEDDLTGLIAMDGRQFIFKQRSILYIVGSGPSRANTQDDTSSPQLVTTDVGCISAKSLVLVPEGIMFMSDKGIYLLNRKLVVSYIGANVERFNSNTVTSAILLEKVNEVRFTTLEGEVLVYNYLSAAWSWFTGLPSVGACIWKGKYTLLLTDGKLYAENPAHNKMTGVGVPVAIVQTISTPWIRSEQVQDWQKIYETLILGYYKTPHQIKLSVYYDYEEYVSETYTIDPLSSASYNTTVRPTNTELEAGTKTNGVYAMRVDMIRKNCQAFRVVIEDIPGSVLANTGECFALSNITITVGSKKGPAKFPASKSY